MDSVLQTIDPRTLGARIQDIRRDAGLTQQQLADVVGMSRTTIVAIEKGERRLTPGEAVGLAKACRRSVSDLVGRKPVTESFVPQFRSTQEYDSSLEPLGQELQRLAEDFNELERISGMPAPRLYPPLYDTGGGPAELIAEEIATSERARLGAGDGPISDLKDLLSNQVGVRIFHFTMPSKIAGLFAFNQPLGACIAINANHPADRRKWSLAHEYGHFLTSRFQPDVTVLFEQKRSSLKERIADAFAENFLMPATGLNKRITDLHRSLPQGISLAHVLELASLYGVSAQAMVRRLETLKRLPYGTWDRLIAEGLRVREAQHHLGISKSDLPEQRLPSHFLRMATYCFNDGRISEGQFASLLRTDRITARELANQYATPFHSEEEGFAAYQLNLGQLLES